MCTIMVKWYQWKSFCISQNNYISTYQVGILVKNEANELYDLKILNSQKLSCLVGLFGLESFHGFIFP